MTDRRTRAVVRAVIAMLASGLWVSAGAQSLTSVKGQRLPPLPGSASPTALAVIDGRPVAITRGSAWVLALDRTGWTESRWQGPGPGGVIRGVAGDGRRAFLLLDGPRTGAVERVARLTFDRQTLVLRMLPPLPVALANAVGAPHSETLYLAGTDAAGAPQLLQLVGSDDHARWVMRDGWPGGGAPGAIVLQTAAVFVVAANDGGRGHRMLRYTADGGWRAIGEVPGSILTGSGRAIGQAHALYLLRDGGDTWRLMSFHTISESWAALPYHEVTAPLTVAGWGNGLLLGRDEGGQIGFELAEIQSGKLLLKELDWVVIGIYLAAMVGIGLFVYLRDRNGSTSDFFVGGRTIPFWAAGVSLYATNTSSISYMAIPAKAFETNWQYLANNLITVLGLMFVATWIVPLLRRLDLVSVFSYLETRFHPAIRMLASALCILMQVGSRMSVVLFLPALAIATITGIDVVWSVLIMGVCTIVYTAMGGMRAVIWTDFLQAFVLMGGALFAIGYVVFALGGDVVYATAMANDKVKLLDFSFDLTKATVWGFIFLVLFDVVLTFPKDQVLMQRTLATKSDRDAGRSIWIFAAITIPGGFVFYSIGTALFVYYKANPERLDPLMPIDATFPLFIAAELPMGITGLIIAGILAAAMSTLSSIINSVATLLSVDFYDRLARNPTQRNSMRFAEWMSVVIGLVGIALALLLSRYDIHSLLDVTIELSGLLGGGFAGAYTLGMFTRRANSPGVAIGIASAIVVTLFAWSMDLVHPYFYLGISIAVCIVVGYLASLLFPPPSGSLAGLIIDLRKTARD